MERMSAKAAAKPAKGGLPNLLYLWATAEKLPPLTGVGELHVLMPWGSLVRGILGSSPEMLRGLAAVCPPDAAFLVALNLHAWRPPVPEVGEHPEPTPETVDEGLAALRAGRLAAHRLPVPGRGGGGGPGRPPGPAG
uniref:16S ribosomal RNA methylase n=1 Tax=Streptoalloteichus hindustanus TaxID=2017 RepID=P72462_STRHI|nr:16S ribosomal RNA methylase [Streptoalloteichus hindustanus]